MSLKFLKISRIKFVLILICTLSWNFGLITFFYDRKTKRMVFSRKLWFLNGIGGVCVIIIFIFNIYIAFITNDFLLVQKISEISIFACTIGFISVNFALFSFWYRAEEFVNTFNKISLILEDIQRLVNPGQLFGVWPMMIILYKITVSLLRFIMYIWDAMEVARNYGVLVKLSWISLNLQFNSVHVISDWYVLASLIRYQLYKNFSEQFKLYLKGNFVGMKELDKRREFSKIQYCCDISDKLDDYAQILDRIFRICNELDRHFELIIVAAISFSYSSVLAAAYFLYFTYVDPRKLHSSNLLFLVQKHAIGLADLSFIILVLFVANFTKINSEKIRSNFQNHITFEKLDVRLEKTVSRLFKINLILLGELEKHI